MRLAWLPADGWRALLEAGFEIVACYGCSTFRPTPGEDSIWLARRSR